MQQRYIYPPSVIEGAEALYNDPNLGDGFTTVSQELLKNDLLLDRSIQDKIEIPLDVKDLEIAPNELASSNSIYNIIDGIHKNYLYLITRASLISNVLPGNYRGYYTNTGDDPGEPIFRENQETDTAYVPPTGVDSGGNITMLPTAPGIDNTRDGDSLNGLVDGVWVRDNSSITRDISTVAEENWHYGFLATPTTLTVVKMSSRPNNQTQPEYGPGGEITGGGGWKVLDTYTTVEELPSESNELYFNNITSVKASDSKSIYVLDRGIDQPGITNISGSSRRSMLYRYDMSGYLNYNIRNHIQSGKRLLKNVLGDLNTSTNPSDVIDPIAFTVKQNDTLIIFDIYDYTFKEYDKQNNFLGKYPKRNIVFRGATGSPKEYIGIVDIHHDINTKHLYILSEDGIIIILDEDYEVLDTIHIPKDSSNQSSGVTNTDISLTYYKTDKPGDPKYEKFLSLEFSQNEPNIYYVVTTNRVIKRFVSRSEINVGVFNMMDNGIGMFAQRITGLAYRALPKFISIFQEAYVTVKDSTQENGEIVTKVDTDRSYTYDQIYMYTDFIDSKVNITRSAPVGMEKHYILSFEERTNVRSNLIKTDFPIYYISDTSSITFKEYNSDFVYNKLLYKVISNHLWLIHHLSYKLAAKYTPTGVLVYDRREYIMEREYRSLLYDFDDLGHFVGVNEYFTTAVLNRCFSKIVNIQNKIANVLEVTKNNTWPPEDLDVPVEPFLHTNGTEYNDIDGNPYFGYYFIYSLANEEIPVTGRSAADGNQSADGSPSTNRFLTVIET